MPRLNSTCLAIIVSMLTISTAQAQVNNEAARSARADEISAALSKWFEPKDFGYTCGKHLIDFPERYDNLNNPSSARNNWNIAYANASAFADCVRRFNQSVSKRTVETIVPVYPLLTTWEIKSVNERYTQGVGKLKEHIAKGQRIVNEQLEEVEESRGRMEGAQQAAIRATQENRMLLRSLAQSFNDLAERMQPPPPPPQIFITVETANDAKPGGSGQAGSTTANSAGAAGSSAAGKTAGSLAIQNGKGESANGANAGGKLSSSTPAAGGKASNGATSAQAAAGSGSAGPGGSASGKGGGSGSGSNGSAAYPKLILTSDDSDQKYRENQARLDSERKLASDKQTADGIAAQKAEDQKRKDKDAADSAKYRATHPCKSDGHAACNVSR